MFFVCNFRVSWLQFTGLSSVAVSDPLTSVLVPQYSTSSTASTVPSDGKEEVLAGLVDRPPPAFSRRSRKLSRNNEDILNFLKIGNKRMQKTLELIDNSGRGGRHWMESLSRTFTHPCEGPSRTSRTR